MPSPKPYEIAVPEAVLDDLRERLGRTRWPELTGSHGWELGADVDYLRDLCDHWADAYDWRATEVRLNALPNLTWDGIHLWRLEGNGSGLPILLIHGWPGSVLEFEEIIPLLLAAGHDLVIPSLPGYGFSDAPDPPLNVAGIAERLRELMDALGYERYAVQGGDWGSIIAARIAFDDPGRVAARPCECRGRVARAGEPGGAADE